MVACAPGLIVTRGQALKIKAAVATDVAVGSAADVAFGHLAADVVFRAIGADYKTLIWKH